MDANIKVTIFNKGASLSTVTYNNWDDSTSRSVKIIGGEKMVVYNWYEPDANNPGYMIATYEDIFNLQVRPNQDSIIITNFGYDVNQITIRIESGAWTQ